MIARTSHLRRGTRYSGFDDHRLGLRDGLDFFLLNLLVRRRASLDNNLFDDRNDLLLHDLHFFNLGL